jgi:hypothetical protein
MKIIKEYLIRCNCGGSSLSRHDPGIYLEDLKKMFFVFV